MSYIKQNFTDGQVLNAEHLNKMEDGIEGVSKIIVTEGTPDTLTWDGNTDGLVSVADMLYKVSDATPTAQDVANGCLLAYDDGIPKTIMFVEQNGAIIEEFARVAIIPNNVAGADIMGFVFPEKGVYFMNDGSFASASLTIPGYTGFATEKLNPKLMPEHLPWAEEPVTTTEVILEEASYTFADGMCQVVANVNLVDGAECIVTWDGVEYVSVCKEYIEDSQSVFAFGNPAIVQIEENPIDNGQPFGIGYVPSYQMLMMMTVDAEATSHTIKIVSTSTTQVIHKLDSKYIEIDLDNIGAEWIAHSEHKTNVLIGEPVTVTITDMNGFNGAELAVNTVTEDEFLNYPESITVVWNGVEYKCPVFAGFGAAGNLNLLVPDAGIGDEYPFLIRYNGSTSITVVAAEPGDVTIDSIVLESNLPVKMPNKYLNFDQFPIGGSDNPITSGAVYTALGNKNKLTFDTTPKSGSTNPITSGAVYTALQNAGSSGLPKVTTSDNGAFLRVVNGAWSTAMIPNVEEAIF